MLVTVKKRVKFCTKKCGCKGKCNNVDKSNINEQLVEEQSDNEMSDIDGDNDMQT